MSSLLTNTSAMVALQTLSSINKDMETTQGRISTGMRVKDASDNAAYWSIATTMKSDNSALSAVKDSLGLGAATVDVAFTAMDKAVAVVDQIKSKLTAATNGTVDKSKVQADIKQLQEQLKTIASSATFSGENWLQQDKATASLNKEIAGSFTRDASGAVSIENIAVDTSTIVLVDTQATAANRSGVLNTDLTGGATTLTFTAGTTTTRADASFALTTATDYSGLKLAAYESAGAAYLSSLSDADAFALTAQADFEAATVTKVDAALADAGKTVLDFDISKLDSGIIGRSIMDAMIGEVDKQLTLMTAAATDLGSAKSRVDMQTQFAGALSDAITRGVGQLVDADMNAESTRLKALQTQQQLGIQALSIANSASQNILSLFR